MTSVDWYYIVLCKCNEVHTYGMCPFLLPRQCCQHEYGGTTYMGRIFFVNLSNFSIGCPVYEHNT